jgi:sulfite reductase alpha subunit-like flavoprotein
MNDAELMEQLKQQFRVDCKEFGRESRSSLPFKTPATLLEILQADVDLALHPSGVPDLVSMLNRRLDVVADLDQLAQDPIFQQYRALIDPIVKGSDDEKHQATNDLTDRFPTIMDFLEEFRSLFGGEPVPKGKSAPAVSLGEVLALLARLQPRYYSICSSSQTNPSEVAITVGVLHRQTPAGILVDGVCSNYLARLRPGIDRAKITLRKSTFRGPSDVKAPVIMIGPGTGLAPMMGFIEDRCRALKNAQLVEDDKECDEFDCHLFFGCRSQADRIYKKPLESYESDGVVNFHLALSRESPKQYVQDKLREMDVSLCELLLNERTHYYICGDAKMADDCYEVCVETLRKHNSMSRVSAVQHLKRMRAEERWQMDLWGLVRQFKESRDTVARMKKKAAQVWLCRFVEGE